MAVNNANASICIYPLVFFFLNLLLCTTPFQCGATTDCVQDGSVIKIVNNKSILTSSRFEFGFFNPDGSSNNSKYLGIWYNGSNPKIVVWVANRDKPLLKPTGFLVIQGGNAKLLDSMNDGKTYWSTRSIGLRNASLCLTDLGNLMLQDSRPRPDMPKGKILWQSFDHPTDTFLPGMYAGGSLNLTCWKTNNNPALGDFTLQLDKDSISLLKMGSPYYSENGVINYHKKPDQILVLLLADPVESNYNNTRLVMNSTGEIQLWENDRPLGWFSTWNEPEDKCTSECGFGSCNMHTNEFCKCFPGFVKGKQLNSEGCSPKSEICQRNYSADVFLRMPMIQVQLPFMNENMSSKKDCETVCRKDCQCVAYSCGGDDCVGASNPSEKRCYMWPSKLPVLKEEHPEGLTIFIRTAQSDLELSSRNCSPCGSYTIPYPLSTATVCGDPSYHDFLCNTTTGQVGFLTSKGTLRVSLIDPDSKKFCIQIRNYRYCDTRYIETHILTSKHS